MQYVPRMLRSALRVSRLRHGWNDSRSLNDVDNPVLVPREIHYSRLGTSTMAAAAAAAATLE